MSILCLYVCTRVYVHVCVTSTLSVHVCASACEGSTLSVYVCTRVYVHV